MTRLITKTYTIGRNAENDINPSKMPALDTERISRKHAVIDFYNDGTIDITDKSSNGTFVNEKRLQKDMPTPVRTSDAITLAGIRFRWQTLPEFEGMTDISSSANTSYMPPAAAAPAPNRPPVQSAAAKQGFSWKIGVAGVLALLVVGIGWHVKTKNDEEAQRRAEAANQQIFREYTDSVEKARMYAELLKDQAVKTNDAATVKIFVYFNNSYQIQYPTNVKILSIKEMYGTGSGFIVNNNGYIITNYHVIELADKAKNSKSFTIFVKSKSLTESYKATIIAGYPDQDLAILQLEPRAVKQLEESGLNPIEFSDEGLDKATAVYALGYTGELDNKRINCVEQIQKLYDQYKNGSISPETFLTQKQEIFDALKDETSDSDYTSGEVSKIEEVPIVPDSPVNVERIDHQAPIRPGMSGGPLFSKKTHKLIGINHALIADSKNPGIYFAINASVLRKILDDRGIDYSVANQ